MADANLNENLDIVAQSNLDIQLLDGDLNIIQKLDDEPNDVGGMTSAELKATFDKAGNIIKGYINETLIPAILADDATEAARAAAEAARETAESERAAAEQGRVEAETARVASESSRVTAEQARSTAETARDTAEQARAAAETARAAAETQRANAESLRASAESSRATAETARANAESARETAEAARAAAEQARADENTGIVAQAAAQANIASSAATSAGNSATAAAASKSAAASSASSAAGSAAAASTSETNAKASESAAASSASTAQEAARDAAASASQAAEVVGKDFATRSELAEKQKKLYNLVLDAPIVENQAIDDDSTFALPSAISLTEGDQYWADIQFVWGVDDIARYQMLSKAVANDTGVTVAWNNGEITLTTAGITTSGIDGNIIITIAKVVSYESADEGPLTYQEGHYCVASGGDSHVEGFKTVASARNSHAEGWNTEASGQCSHAEGNETTASGLFSHAEGCNTTASGFFSHAEGYSTTASDNGSHAEGEETTASGLFSHAEGSNTTASGYVSHAEGNGTKASSSYSHAEGSLATASGYVSHAEGYRTEASGWGSHAEGYRTEASGERSHAEGCNTTASNYSSHAQGKYSKAMTTGGAETNTTGDAMVIGNGTGSSALSNAFRVTFAGAVYGLSAFNSTGADYSEFFEWADLNPAAEDRVGYFVTLVGKQIRMAGPGDYILGIVSGQPCIIGNADEDWLGRWEHDAFGRFIKDDTEDSVVERKMVGVPVLDDNGNPTGKTKLEMQEVQTGEVIHGWRYKANPDYDPTQEYIERKDRPEWDCVGMLGVLAVRDDGTCGVNGYCRVADGGIATAADAYIPGTTYRVIERVADNVIKVIFR